MCLLTVLLQAAVTCMNGPVGRRSSRWDLIQLENCEKGSGASFRCGERDVLAETHMVLAAVGVKGLKRTALAAPQVVHALWFS